MHVLHTMNQPFSSQSSLLIPLKISENSKGFQGDQKGTLGRKGLIYNNRISDLWLLSVSAFC